MTLDSQCPPAVDGVELDAEQPGHVRGSRRDPAYCASDVCATATAPPARSWFSPSSGRECAPGCAALRTTVLTALRSGLTFGRSKVLVTQRVAIRDAGQRIRAAARPGPIVTASTSHPDDWRLRLVSISGILTSSWWTSWLFADASLSDHRIGTNDSAILRRW